MQKWDYCILSYYYRAGYKGNHFFVLQNGQYQHIELDKDDSPLRAISVVLGELGEEGWEAVDHSSETGSLMWTLKRPLP